MFSFFSFSFPLLFLCLFGTIPAVADETASDDCTEIREQLISLKKWQGKYQGKAKAYLKKARRLQFINSTEAKQYKALAQKARENADLLQDQIHALRSEETKRNRPDEP